MRIKKLHPVIKHILARKNKKVPIKDGRKIVLVLYGGAMTSIRGAGTMIAFNELGMDQVFDEIYAFSGGFCNASYLLSGNGKEGTSIYYEDLSGTKFINLKKVWKVADVDYVIKCIRKIKPLNVKNILKHPSRLFVQMDNLRKKEIQFHEVHDHSPSEYFSLIKAAIKIPYLSPGGVHIGSGEFKDTLEDKIFEKALHSKATDILVVYNMLDQHQYVHKHFPANIFKTGRIFEIKPSRHWDLSRLETKTEVLKEACVQMGNMVKRILGSRKPISLEYKKESQARSR